LSPHSDTLRQEVL